MDARQLWDEGIEIRKKVKKRPEEIEDAKAIATAWKDDGEKMLPFITTEWMARHVKRLAASGLSFNEITAKANVAVYNRLRNGTRGVSSSLFLQPCDITKILEMKEYKPLEKAELRSANLRIGPRRRAQAQAGCQGDS